MTENSIRQAILDEEHLKLLSLGYMISAAMSAFSSLFGLWFVVAGTMFHVISKAPAAAAQSTQQPPPFLGWVFAGIGIAFFIAFIVMAVLKLKAAFDLKRHTSRTFCMVVAGITCLGVPYGTALGVLTFIVLGRPTVAEFFAARANSITPAIT